ncbi:hypothetical protein SAPIO_CDS1910 [Scedosporium apiospermum]|uniref:Major facilitator superfamily (MFS) profile domain-containing protein n=1 Tax=Pseudallescheria apiosperma TaxID=563466 RepID=A0A084GE11_PSEDA|nr:uncharacterized protein SAPIO_CDS1910 [Scedosporium apiospermum]KEZ45573.1 hypothetical protein SAPIO_CDS1910 [Scedosporium apiospermum]
MGLFGKKEAELAVGQGLVTVLPPNPKSWYRTPHLIKLNLVLLVPLFSSASVGYDVTYLCDRYGRKFPLYIGFAGAIGFAILQGLSNNVAIGKFTALYQTCYYFGAIFAAWCTYGTFRLDSTWSWRIPSILQCGIPVIQACGLYFLPESPRWLASRGRREEARQILADWHAGGDLDSPLVAFELNEIEAAIQEECEVLSQVSWLELFRTPANRKRTLIAVLVGWFAQWNGVGVISYYLTLVLNTVGITEVKDQTLINGLLQIFNWLASVFAGAMMVDRLGRRTLFLASSVGMLAGYIVWTGLTSSFVSTKSESTGRAVVALIFIYYFFYDIAFSPLLQAYTVEIFPYTLRSRGLSAMYITTFIGLIVGNQVNPIAMKAIGWKYYIVFCCLLAVLVVIVWFLFPETKGHTLEEIREVFEGKLNASQDKLGSAETGEANEKGHEEADEKEARIEKIE